MTGLLFLGTVLLRLVRGGVEGAGRPRQRAGQGAGQEAELPPLGTTECPQ